MLPFPVRSVASGLFLSIAVYATGCGGDGGADSTTQTSTALDSAQCTFKRSRGTEDACFKTYVSCVSAPNSDAAACRKALQDCVPKPPALPSGSSEDTRGEGGRGHGGGDDRGGGGGGKGDGKSPPHPLPDPTVVAQCRTALDSCLASLQGDQSACFKAHNTCVDEAFRAAFQKQCDNIATKCANADDDAEIAACDAVKKRCSEGVGGRFANGATPCP